MDCQAIEKYHPIPQTRKAGWLFWLGGLLRRPASRHPTLDLEVMSEYMKRDLGFLDGRDSRADSDLTR